MILPDKYYEWLLYRVCNSDFQRNEYSMIFQDLASVEFRSSVERDDNLLEHVKYYLREGFTDEAEEHGVNVTIDEDLPVSLLEVMVVLAVKAEDIMQSFDGVDYSRWFWHMMKNSGLAFYTNYRYNKSGSMMTIRRILERKYEQNGRGGLFYIRRIDTTKYDLTEIELWYQLMWYINEVNEEA